LRQSAESLQRICDQLTVEKKFENGRPLSLENTQISRETDANTLNRVKSKIRAGINTKKFVAGIEFVAW
jgi:hypothetical protein